MAKKKKSDTETGAAVGAEETTDEPMRRFRVHLEAKTPLAHPVLVVEARNEADAKRKYNHENGISGSDHTYNIDETDEEVTITDGNGTGEPVSET